MKILLDTCTFLWIAVDSPRLSSRARELFVDPANDVFLSAVSCWEISIKNRLGQLPLPSPAERFVVDLRQAYDIDSLPLDEESALHEHRLPPMHRDPFDRALVCQSLVHGLMRLTPDSMITQYPVRSTW